MAEEENREQIAAQCEAVAYMARALADVHADSAKIIRAGYGVPSIIGPRSAHLMEVLGNVLNEMDANDPEDAWMDPIFDEAHRLFSQSEPA